MKLVNFRPHPDKALLAAAIYSMEAIDRLRAPAPREQQSSDWDSAIARRCPKCGAVAGASCRNPSGRLFHMHTARRVVK